MEHLTVQHGMGTINFVDGSIYVGEFKDGKMHGKGVFTWSDGDTYDGEFQKGKKCGHGVFLYAEGFRYEGAFFDDKKHGIGVWTSVDCKTKYHGDYKYGMANGKGIWTK